MIKIFLSAILLAGSIASIFVGWRYYDRFDWCRENVREGADISRIKNPTTRTNNINDFPSFEWPTYKTLTKKYYSFQNGEKYNTYEEAMDSCKSQWVDNII